MKKYIKLFLALIISNAVASQTPYDDFDSTSARPMLELRKSEFVLKNPDSCSVVKYVKLQMESQLLHYYDKNDSLVAIALLEGKAVKFLSIDPLASEFAWNSPYSYAENTPISCIDLDGAERYYTANGALIGQIGSSPQKRVVKAENVATVAFWVNAANTPPPSADEAYSGRAANRANQFSFADESTFSNWYANHSHEYNSAVEAHRAWQSDPNPHEGEGKWDRLFRLGANASMEARRDYASGGMNMYGGYGKAAGAAEQGANAGANLSTSGANLAKSLASEAQMAEQGITIIASGKLTEATRLAEQYGGKALDWVKKTSSSYKKDGKIFETHWYENTSTGTRAEFKTILVK